MKYKCQHCKYESNDKSNYNKHLRSMAHTIQQKTQKNIDPENLDDSKFICVCERKFKYASGLSKHKKLCIVANEQTEIQILKSELERMKKMQENGNEMLKEILVQNKQHVTHNTTYNISVHNYAKKNYSNAPPLKGPTDFAKLTYEDNSDLASQLTKYYNMNRLPKFLGMFIIRYYKKDNPNDQSLWSTDQSRVNYTVKELPKNGKSLWKRDQNGEKIKERVIKPLLKHITEYINKYYLTCASTDITEYTAYEMKKYSDTLIALGEIKVLISDKTDWLSDAIVKFIGSKFIMNAIDDDKEISNKEISNKKIGKEKKIKEETEEKEEDNYDTNSLEDLIKIEKITSVELIQDE